MARKIEATGQLTTQQKSATNPRAAPTAASSPIRDAATHPKVEPIKKVGTISPPLKPAATVIAVKRIFKRNE